MGRRRVAGAGAAKRQRARRFRLLAVGVSSLTFAGCAELLDLPDDPRVVDSPPERVSSATDPNGSAGEAPEGDRVVAEPDGREDIVTPSLASPEAPALAGAGSEVNVTIVDAGPDAGTDAASDAGGDDAGPAPEAPVPEEPAEPPCAGQPLFGVCWYLGAAGDSCEETCAPHGGPSPLAPQHVGTTQQGGSNAECSAILAALGANTPAATAQRLTAGVGCHTFGAEGAPFWLSFPSFDPGDSVFTARIACGCEG
jgi:hypothetical protein